MHCTVENKAFPCPIQRRQQVFGPASFLLRLTFISALRVVPPQLICPMSNRAFLSVPPIPLAVLPAFQPCDSGPMVQILADNTVTHTGTHTLQLWVVYISSQTQSASVASFRFYFLLTPKLQLELAEVPACLWALHKIHISFVASAPLHKVTYRCK